MESTISNALVIFAQNTDKQKVKRKLASDVGDETAAAVYKYLLKYTAETAMLVHCHRFVFYTEYIHLNDAFDDHCFTKFVQEGADEGQRMKHAFEKVYSLHHQNVCLIESDCYQLQASHIQQAFDALEQNDVVIGPTEDGGYYLIAMKKVHQPLFEQAWGTAAVLGDTIAAVEKLKLKYILLQPLNDIDTIEDLNETDIMGALAEDE